MIRKHWNIISFLRLCSSVWTLWICCLWGSLEGVRRGGHYVVTSILIEPYLMINPRHANDTGNLKYTGYIADLMQELSAKVGIKYRLHEVTDKNYGTRRADGTWDGMIGELTKGIAGIAAAPLYITKQRQEAVAFTEPFLTVEATVLLSQNQKSYAPQISSARDLLHQDHVQYGTLNTGIIVHAFKSTNNTVDRQLFETMKEFSPSVFTRSNQEGIDRVRAGGYAFVLPSTIGEYIAKQAPCDLITVDRFLMKRHFALAVKKDSYILSELNKGLTILKKQGRLDLLYKRWWLDQKSCKGYKSSSVVSKHSADHMSNMAAGPCTLFNQKYSSLMFAFYFLLLQYLNVFNKH